MQTNAELTKICSVSTGFDADRFVGIKMYNGKPQVHFPIGFQLSEQEPEIREDICLLLKILKTFHYKEERNIRPDRREPGADDFPIFAYQRMVLRFLNDGNYTEFENLYENGVRGKINWSRTIKKCNPSYTNNGPVYTEFMVKRNRPLNNSLIAQIYDYCVYCSFVHIGWLYTNKSFRKPKIKFNKNLFKAVVLEKLSSTNTDRSKELFSDMLSIIESQRDEVFQQKDYMYGTFEFEYVWEKLIDGAFGIKEKSLYFPRSYWHVKGVQANRALEPDTIMIKGKNVYVLDGKYYKYGYTGSNSDLPNTSSIHKQITYGEYIDSNPGFSFEKIYNAFLLPGNLQKSEESHDKQMHYIGYAVSDWKQGDKLYEKIAGIVIDTKFLMSEYLSKDKLIKDLSEEIENNIK